MKSNDGRNARHPLACMNCEKDLLETKYGVVVHVRNEELVNPQHYDYVYWTCKGRCDEAMQVKLGVTRKPTPWIDLRELLNPLGYRRWVMVKSRQIACGRLHASAAANVRELNRLLAQVALREPTPEDEDEFWRFRMMDGL